MPTVSGRERGSGRESIDRFSRLRTPLGLVMRWLSADRDRETGCIPNATLYSAATSDQTGMCLPLSTMRPSPPPARPPPPAVPQCPPSLIPAGARSRSRISGVSLLCIARNPVISSHVGGCLGEGLHAERAHCRKVGQRPSFSLGEPFSGMRTRCKMIAMTHSGEARPIALSAAIAESGEINEHGTRYGNVPLGEDGCATWPRGGTASAVHSFRSSSSPSCCFLPLAVPLCL
jgi:hypothetical protein